MGWAVTQNNEILYTQEGCNNFYNVRKIEATNVTTENYLYANFISPTTAYIVYFSENGTKVMIEHTDNAGQSWHHSSVNHKDYSNPHSVYIDMLDENTGYLLYYGYPSATKPNKILLETTDGGQIFTAKSDLSSELKGVPTGMAFINQDIGYFPTTNKGVENFLYLTQDGSMTWKMDNIIEDDNDYNFMEIYAPVFHDEKRKNGKIILKQEGQGLEYVLMSTSNRGSLWIKEAVLDIDEIKSYSFTDKKNGYIIDGEGVLHKISIKKLW